MLEAGKKGEKTEMCLCFRLDVLGDMEKKKRPPVETAGRPTSSTINSHIKESSVI